MIEVSRINGQTIFVNPELIRFVSATPDTLLTFIDGQTLLVKNTPKEIADKCLLYRQTCLRLAGNIEFKEE